MYLRYWVFESDRFCGKYRGCDRFLSTGALESCDRLAWFWSAIA
ncbi:MAG: hypothetical protein ACIWVG_06940 [Gloeotrichia echinulata HAB0833]